MSRKNQFEYVVEAFQKEPTIKEHKNLKGWSDKAHQEHIEKGICAHLYVRNTSVELQFLGWELVLLKDGKYYINDTSGG